MSVPPQNGGESAKDDDRKRYATFIFFDYQKNLLSSVSGDTGLQQNLLLTQSQIESLISFVNNQMKSGTPDDNPPSMEDGG